MDDLRMLRELGRELEHEPPPALTRQRALLLDKAAGARVESRREHRTLGGWPLLALVGAVTAVLIITPVVVLGGGRSPAHHAAGSRDDGGRPYRPGRSINVLVIGSDARVGGGAAAAPERSARSDTLMLLHVSADRKSVSGLSFPRDTMVRIPACRASRGTTAAGPPAAINSAFTVGGSACTVATVELLTGIRVDHVVTIEFAGFKAMVDALGGVEMTVPQVIDDPQAHLRLQAGRQVLDGERALGYVRLRKSVGDGSDLGRIARQHDFMVALAAAAKRRLSDPRRLIAFLRVAMRSISTDSGLDLQTALSIARSMAQTPPAALRFTTLPVRPYAPDPNRLAVDRAAAEKVFARFRQN